VKQFFITVAGVFVGLIVFAIASVFLLVFMISSSVNSATRNPATPNSVVLELDLRDTIPDQRNPAAFFLGGHLNTIDIIRKLEAAADDSKVKGVYVRAATGGLDPAQAEEIRSALARVHAAKKFVVTSIQNDGETMSLLGYTASAGSDEIWLQETGDFMPMGILAQNMYLGGALQKFHMKAEFEAREQYKDAITQFTERAPTPASKEATTALLGSIYDTALADIAADRKMTLAAAKAVVEGSPYTSADAVKLKLADKLGRPEDARQAALDKAGSGSQILELEKYNPPAKTGGATIALVTAEGEIAAGKGDGPKFNGRGGIASDDLSTAILQAADDDNVKAIVFRVSSPGGSAVASDQIAHAVALARKKGKKVVVSMGPYAASGGYYISAGADSIIALPTTITGSIGIFGGKIVIGEALDHYLGVTTANTLVGSPSIEMFDSTTSFTPAQRKVFAAMIDRGYADFLGTVAAGRHMTTDKVREVAKGRVWTGAQAKERGLVDELGGLDVAIARAKALAGLKPDDKVQIKLYPQEKNPFEQLQDLFGVSSESARAALTLSAVMGDKRVTQAMAVAAADRDGLRAEGDPLLVH
jgi:protease-4